MSTTINDGGPAFPREFSKYRTESNDGKSWREQHFMAQDGMALRDWFAGQALEYGYTDKNGIELPPHEIAKKVYFLADAMLAARAQEDRK